MMKGRLYSELWFHILALPLTGGATLTKLPDQPHSVYEYSRPATSLVVAVVMGSSSPLQAEEFCSTFHLFHLTSSLIQLAHCSQK